jgi:hypothetical protein
MTKLIGRCARRAVSLTLARNVQKERDDLKHNMSIHSDQFNETLLHHARRLVKGGQRDAAIQMVEELVGANPSDLGGWLFLASYSVGVDHARAIIAWEYLTLLRPHDAGTRQALAALRETLARPLSAPLAA